MLEEQLEAFEVLCTDLAKAGQGLTTACEGSIFPCDALAITASARAINLVKGFETLIESDNYECAAALLRFQLDNVLRFYGVITCSDPHDTASKMLAGTALSKLKHPTGEQMTDGYLAKLISETNSWVPDVYKLLSGFVHLSDQHFQSLLLQSDQTENGIREFKVSGKSEYILEEHKLNLVRSFASVTRGFTSMVVEWSKVRGNFGTTEQLKKKYSQII